MLVIKEKFLPNKTNHSHVVLFAATRPPTLTSVKYSQLDLRGSAVPTVLVTGTIADLVIFIFVSVLVIIGFTGKIKFPKPKKFQAITVIEEIVGRCTELNQPIFSDPGRWSDVTTMSSASGFAGMAILSYVARLCAKFNTKLIVFTQNEPLLTWMETTVKAPFVLSGSSVQPEVRYVPQVLGNMYTATLALAMEREKAGALISLGPLLTSAAIASEAGARIGAVTLMGTDQTAALGFLAVSAEHIMIGEEIFAAAAIVSEDEVAMNTVTTQDFSKALFIVIMTLGVVLSSLRIPWLSILLRS